MDSCSPLASRKLSFSKGSLRSLTEVFSGEVIETGGIEGLGGVEGIGGGSELGTTEAKRIHSLSNLMFPDFGEGLDNSLFKAARAN